VALIRVCHRDAIPPGSGLRADIGRILAIFEVDGEVLAVDDECPHARASLSEGYVDGDVVECPWHLSKFRISTGEVLSLPATAAIRTYPVLVKEDGVYVEVEEPD